jgi:hypothetical protein
MTFSNAAAGASDESAVNEKSGRIDNPTARSQLNILLDLRFVAATAQTGIELLVIQL